MTAPLLTEEQCIRYLELVRWNGEAACPRCGCPTVYRIRTRRHYKCRKCRRNFTARHGTIFVDGKLSLAAYFEAIRLMIASRQSITSIELARRLGVSQKTSHFVIKRIQHVLA